MDAMLATRYEGQLPASWTVEPKLDGVRVLITFNAKFKEVSFRTRNGKRLKSMEHLANEVLAFAGEMMGDVTLDAEAIDGDFYSSVGKARSNARFQGTLVVFDIVTPDRWDDRRAFLETWTHPTDSIRLIETHRQANVDAAYASARANGYEGVVVKDRDSFYEPGERSGAWQKLKPVETHDCRVTEVGTDKQSLTIDFNGVAVKVPLTAWGLDAQPISVGQLVEVSCQEATPSGSMRHPRLVKVRWDK